MIISLSKGLIRCLIEIDDSRQLGIQIKHDLWTNEESKKWPLLLTIWPAKARDKEDKQVAILYCIS